MGKDRRQTYSTGIRLSKDIADKIQEFAEKERRSFANAIERLAEIALEKVAMDESILADAQNLKKKTEVAVERKRMSA